MSLSFLRSGDTLSDERFREERLLLDENFHQLPRTGPFVRCNFCQPLRRRLFK